MRRSLSQFHIRAAALLMVCFLAAGIMPTASAAEVSGECGDNLTWSLSGDVLTITGTGAMYDYPESTMAPWYDYRAGISAVRLPDGLTRVGDLAFYGCTALRAVSLPDSVIEVGWFAFASCTGLQLLDLGSGLRVIEQAGFRECMSLGSVRLPNSLVSLGFQAFYRCEALTEITVPASVTNMGMTAFAYCYSLVRANVHAEIATLPDWTFYGCARLTDVYLSASITGAQEDAFGFCESLSSVSSGGSPTTVEQLKSDVSRDLAGDSGLIDVSEGTPGDSTSSTTFTEENGDLVSDTITAVQTDNASVSADVEVIYPDGSAESAQSAAHIDVTLENAQGWSEVADTVTEIAESAASATVNAYLKDDSALPAEAVSAFAGQNVTVSVYTASGSAWQVDCAALTETAGETGSYDFSYTREPATAEELEPIGCTAGFRIVFASDVSLNAVVKIKLPAEYARQTATICQIERRDKLTQLQSTVIDDEGYAHFYLASVDADTTYLIGISLPAVETAEAIIPKTLYDAYGVTDTFNLPEYTITGRTSSWGMSMSQVTWIMVGVIAACGVTIGVVMYTINKQKVKRGYVPDYDEDWDEE